MTGLIFAISAGVFISLQTVFNARVSDKAGAWAATSLVLGLGLITSLPVFWLLDGTPLFAVGDMNLLYLFSGAIGVGLVFCIMQAMKRLDPALAISIVLVSQLMVAVCIDTFGWFGFERLPLTWNRLTGLFLLVAGILVFKRKKRVGSKERNRSDKGKQGAYI